MLNVQQCPKCDSVMAVDETGHLTCPNCSLYLNISLMPLIRTLFNEKPERDNTDDGDYLAQYGVG